MFQNNDFKKKKKKRSGENKRRTLDKFRTILKIEYASYNDSCINYVSGGSIWENTITAKRMIHSETL